MKNIFKFWLLLIMSFIFIDNVKAATNPYSQTGSYGTNCTWYAWKMAYEKGKVTLPGWGNAKQWYNEAKNDGYKVGKTPKDNSIVVWGNWTEYGHVGYVEKVEGESIYVWDSTGPCIDREDPEFVECMSNSTNEDTDKICYQKAKRIACEYNINSQDYIITGFIYLDELPKKENNSTVTSTNGKENNINIEKSNNNNLSNIEINVGELDFSKDVLNYKIEVANEINAIEISAIKEDAKATVEGDGRYELNVGLNEFKIIVTAENKDKKEYTIEVLRKELEYIEEDINENKTDNVVEYNTLEKSNSIYIIFAITGVLFVTIIIFIIKKRKTK